MKQIWSLLRKWLHTDLSMRKRKEEERRGADSGTEASLSAFLERVTLELLYLPSEILRLRDPEIFWSFSEEFLLFDEDL